MSSQLSLSPKRKFVSCWKKPFFIIINEEKAEKEAILIELFIFFAF